MSLKAKIEALIYAAENPVTLDQMVQLISPSGEETDLRAQVRTALEELVGQYACADHGIEIRQVAGGYRMATKPEQHDVVRAFAKSLKPPIRLSLPALEKLAAESFQSDLYPAEAGSDASAAGVPPQGGSPEAASETTEDEHVEAGQPHD